jgi:hypothetical protein
MNDPRLSAQLISADVLLFSILIVLVFIFIVLAGRKD